MFFSTFLHCERPFSLNSITFSSLSLLPTPTRSRYLSLEMTHPPIPLVAPLEEGVSARPNEVVVIANDQKTRFALSIKAFTFYSKFAQNVLSGDEGEDVPLESDRATPQLLRLYATWLRHHETVKVSKIPVPIPRLLKVDDYYTDPWDLAFIRQHFVGEDEDMTKSGDLYSLALLSTYLQTEPLTNMICCFFAWHIKRAATLDDPIAEVAKWVGHPPEYTLDEVKEATGWVQSALKGVELPERRSMESDDEYSTPPGS
jgi:hypothetical protein